jgi:hypothetical protein
LASPTGFECNSSVPMVPLHSAPCR